MARKFAPTRERKHKALARQRAAAGSSSNPPTTKNAPPADTNVSEIMPESKPERELRKEALRKQLTLDAPRVSGKKAKRLEKYIEKKLRKDETKELLQKLADSKIDTSLFASTRNLGQGKETKRQALGRSLMEERAGLEVGREERGKLLYEERRDPADRSLEDDIESSALAPALPSTQTSTPAGTFVPAPESTPGLGLGLGPGAGSGLKRPLELDDDGQPVLQKRQKRGGVKKRTPKPSGPVFDDVSMEDAEVEDEDEDGDGDGESEWGGFSDTHVSAELQSVGSERSDEDDGGRGEASGADAESEASESSSGESSEDAAMDQATRSSAFKSWAQQQRNKALGYEPAASTPACLSVPRPPNFEPRPAATDQDELPRELLPTTNTSRKAFNVGVTRTPDIGDARTKLPIIAEEQRIMEAIHDHDTVVICGATGSGKTTQVPQFLYEAGFGAPDSETPGMIGVTQPRRVAAVSMSKRVSDELGEQHGKRVGYQIRFEGTAGPGTAIKFMTDGVLVREVAQQFQLDKYSAIIVDEAHERSVNTDILIGLLSRIVRLRRDLSAEDPKVKPLKLIIMSATLRVADMTHNARLFPTPPPVLEIEGRQHAVTVHFSRRTHHDYVEEAFRKISKGHRRLPPGGMLVFLTGQGEIALLKRKLEESMGGLHLAPAKAKVRISASEAPVEVEDLEFGDANVDGVDDGEDDGEDDDEDDDEFDVQDEERPADSRHLAQPAPAPHKMHILPLYSLLPTREQMRVFAPPPPNARLVILATNVAETSLTIPGIQYVFDCGRSKERRFDPATGVQSYEIGWVSRASANQRAGRAGRTGPGHCYRLYSSAVYENDFAEFAEPELLRMPIEAVVLQLKAMNLNNVVNFPFPTPPDRQAIAKAETLLKYLAVLSPAGQITNVGKTMSIFPLAPRFARILLVGHHHGCMPYTIILVAALSAPAVFVPENQAIIGTLSSSADGADSDDGVPGPEDLHPEQPRTNAHFLAETRQTADRKRFNAAHRSFCLLDDKSDAMKLLKVVGEFAHERTETWCRDRFVRFKILQEIQQLRRQITDLLASNIPAFSALKFQDRLDPPSAKQVVALKQMAAAGFIDQVSIRADLAPVQPEALASMRKPRRAIDVPYLPLVPLANAESPCVYIHPASPLAHVSPAECPEYVVYAHLQRSSAGTGKTRMHALTDVTGGQLATLAKGTPLLRYGKPVKEVKVAGNERECWVVPYLRAEDGGGGMGWPLPMRKVTQKKVADQGWIVI